MTVCISWNVHITWSKRQRDRIRLLSTEGIASRQLQRRNWILFSTTSSKSARRASCSVIRFWIMLRGQHSYIDRCCQQIHLQTKHIKSDFQGSYLQLIVHMRRCAFWHPCQHWCTPAKGFGRNPNHAQARYCRRRRNSTIFHLQKQWRLHVWDTRGDGTKESRRIRILVTSKSIRIVLPLSLMRSPFGRQRVLLSSRTCQRRDKSTRFKKIWKLEGPGYNCREALIRRNGLADQVSNQATLAVARGNLEISDETPCSYSRSISHRSAHQTPRIFCHLSDQSWRSV